jgi:hypothetical protein
MIGGYPATSPTLSAVALVRDCSGVLVRPDRVVTCAHCLTPALEQVTVAGRPFRVRECKAYSGYRPLQAAHDIAVCSLAVAAPVKGIALDEGPAPKAGEEVTLAGYGLTDPLAHEPPELRAVDTAIVSVDAQSFELGSHDHTACLGDSGGPVLVERGGALRVLGVLHGPSGAICASPTRAVRLDVVRDWLVGELSSGDGVRSTEIIACVVIGVLAAIVVALVIRGVVRRLLEV